MNTKLIEWVLRISVAGEFIGHGVFALQGKKDWVGWLSQFGIGGPNMAVQLLFILGIIDIALAILILIKPVLTGKRTFRRPHHPLFHRKYRLCAGVVLRLHHI